LVGSVMSSQPPWKGDHAALALGPQAGMLVAENHQIDAGEIGDHLHVEMY
jgi:hypothetical protein